MQEGAPRYISFFAVDATRDSLVHPSRQSPAADSGGEAQTLASHGEVGDEVPDESDELDDGRDEGEEGALELK